MSAKVREQMVKGLAASAFVAMATVAAAQAPTPRPIVPEVRSGFPLQKAADYGIAPADYDGDGRADLSLKLDGGTWKIDYAANGFGAWDQILTSYGAPHAVPVPADYDGDGRADLAVKDGWGGWRIDYAADGFGGWNVQVGGYGGRETRAAPADYDGDGKADLAVRYGDGRWSIDLAGDGFGAWNLADLAYGGANAEPVPADYDGDGKADVAIKDNVGRWRIDYAANGLGAWDATRTGYGGGTHAVPADYDGDGRADLAVKNDNGHWHIDYSANGSSGFDAVIPNAGGMTARPAPADYDGDGRADLAVRVDCGGWFLDYAASGFGPWNRRFDYLAANAVVTATNASQLAWTIASDFTGTVLIPGGPDIDLSGLQQLPVRSCVQIKGTRYGLDEGRLLFTDYKTEGYSLFNVTGHDVRIEGLRFRGPSGGDRSASQERVSGFTVTVDPGLGLGGNVVIDNNEAWFWTHDAIGVRGQVGVPTLEEVPPGTPLMVFDQAALVRVSRNFIHHNSRNGLGYGVTVNDGAYATIEGNLFDHNRHAISSDGWPHTGYVARYNYVLEGGYTEGTPGYWNQHFDVHGTGSGHYGGGAGEAFEISFNTFRGEQEYALGQYTRAAFMLRGTPSIGAFFRDNVLVHDNRGEAIRIKSPDCWVSTPGGGGSYSDALCHLNVGPNTYDTDTTHDLAVGDFDGDGRDDVFLANGTGWWYSSAGLTEWRFLQASSLRIGSLRFGRFDSDLKTDVVFNTGAEWRFSSGGTGVGAARAGFEGLDLANCAFGDFDGNGRTDALYLIGSSWYLSPGSAGAWSLVRDAPVTAASALRIADFDGDGHDDVFLIENGSWSWWKPGWTTSYPLNAALTSSVDGLVVGDFDGDGRDDLAQTSGNGWRYSRDGSSGWFSLRGAGGQPYYKDIRSVVIGRFGLDAHAVAIRYELRFDFPGIGDGVRFIAWNAAPGDAFTQWSAQYVR